MTTDAKHTVMSTSKLTRHPLARRPQAAAIGAKNAFAMDLTAACSGFLFATVTAGQFLNSGSAKNALVRLVLL